MRVEHGRGVLQRQDDCGAAGAERTAQTDEQLAWRRAGAQRLDAQAAELCARLGLVEDERLDRLRLGGEERLGVVDQLHVAHGLGQRDPRRRPAQLEGNEASTARRGVAVVALQAMRSDQREARAEAGEAFEIDFLVRAFGRERGGGVDPCDGRAWRPQIVDPQDRVGAILVVGDDEVIGVEEQPGGCVAHSGENELGCRRGPERSRPRPAASGRGRAGRPRQCRWSSRQR